MSHTTASPAADEYDRQYRAWVEALGSRALDLDWRLTHLDWRQRALLRRYPPEGKRALDFGCMDGVFTLRLQQLGGEAVGYDISPAAIAQAKQFRGSAARPVFTTVPPGPGQFDLIYCSEALEHVEDDSARGGELVGSLTVGGSVVGTAPVGEVEIAPGQKRYYNELVLKRALSPWGRVRLHRFYRSRVRNLLPIRQESTAVFIFQVTPPNLPEIR
ncbi:MAG TPA: class I SAM-dependent methyltransferase [Gemmatimonadales bacterium]|nr:class I SAM-dependent methyltransferase [Gemmatimonadales bacterium]